MENIKSNLMIRLGLAFGVVLFTQCNSSNQDDGEGIEVMSSIGDENSIILTQPQFESMNMQWGTLENQNFAEEVKVQGEVKVPVEGIQDITPFYGGYVNGLKLIEGQEVRKGEVLFYLESPEFVRLQQNYLEAKSQLSYLKEEFDRQKTLYDEKIASQKGYLKAESEYQTTLAQAESLKKQLGMIHIDVSSLTAETIQDRIPVVSPISGFVESIHTVPGAFLPSASKAATLINTEHIHVELNVFEKDAIFMQKGQEVSFTLPDMPGQDFAAEIHMVGKAISEQRFIPVHAHVLDEALERKLVPGMFLEARIKLNPKEAWSLPSTAIISSEGVDYVLVQERTVDNGFQLAKVKVELGRQNDQLVEVLPNPNLDENAQILIKGGFNLLP